jgi:hypothetical protein
MEDESNIVTTLSNEDLQTRKDNLPFLYKQLRVKQRLVKAGPNAPKSHTCLDSKFAYCGSFFIPEDQLRSF